MAELGFIGPILPEEYGGRGIDYRTYGLIVEEIGRVDSSARTVISVCTSLFGSAIARWGDEEQKQRIIPGLTDGTGLGCFGLTEPDSGSDAASLKTRAEKIDGGWKLTGQKQWISLGNVAKWALIFAQTDPEKAHKGLAAFVVPTDADGFARAARSTASSASRRPTPPSWRWTASRSATTRCSARSATASRWP